MQVFKSADPIPEKHIQKFLSATILIIRAISSKKTLQNLLIRDFLSILATILCERPFMYEYIEGKLIELTPAYAVVEANGVGYFIHISINTYSHRLSHSIKTMNQPR
jgi:hypothetical protein